MQLVRSLLDIIGTARPENRRKSFGYALTEAWLSGIIPNHFDAKTNAYFANANERKLSA